MIELFSFVSRSNTRMLRLNRYSYALGLHQTAEYWNLDHVPESDFVESLIFSKHLRSLSSRMFSAGDVILYRNEGALMHAGIVEGDIIRSKWGMEGSIYRHSTFSIPRRFGSEIAFFQVAEHEDLIRRMREYPDNR